MERHTTKAPIPGTDPANGIDHRYSYIANASKGDYLRRLRRIEGQTRGLQRMVEEEQYCIDILTQISAMAKALQALGLGLLDEHMAHCLVNAARQGGTEAENKLKEASDAIARLVRS
jgi:DNA-binding FrmR family transcriptional regulator